MDKAVTYWREGRLVALPTETVYGLGTDACQGKAVAHIYSVKSRPQFNPLIVHVADRNIAKRYVEWNAWAELLADAFWPGPLTLVLKRLPDSPISELVSAGGDTIAIRIPAHPVAQQLLRGFNGGIAAPSANRSGRVSPTTAQHVLDELGGDIPLIIDGGPCVFGLESTVIDISGDTPCLLRPGSITHAQLERVLKSTVLRHSAESPILSPGQLASHYAPSIPVRLNVTEIHSGEALLAFGDDSLLQPVCTTLNLSPSGDLAEAASHLFGYMRQLDVPEHKGIAVMLIPDSGIGEAINDRLRRAAHRD